MKIKVFLTGMVLILAMAVTAVGADIGGKWIAEQENPQGTQQTTFDFKVNGTTLTGMVTSGGRQGEAEISEGKIDGNTITFAVVRTMGENEMRTLYKGTVSGDEIRFTIERQGGGAGGAGMGAGSGAAKGKPGGAGGGMGGGQRGGGSSEIVAKRAQ